MLDHHTTTSEVSCTATAAISTGSHAEIMHWDVTPSSQDFSLHLFSTIKQVSSSITKIIMLHHEDYYMITDSPSGMHSVYTFLS